MRERDEFRFGNVPVAQLSTWICGSEALEGVASVDRGLEMEPWEWTVVRERRGVFPPKKEAREVGGNP